MGDLGGWWQSVWQAWVRRLPRKAICGPNGELVLERFHLAGRANRWGVVVHHFVRSDPGRGYHDHPWARAWSLILAGGYEERWVPHQDPHAPHVVRRFEAGSTHTLDGRDYHRVMLAPGQDAWTLFVHGPRTKRWGFLGERDRVWRAHNTQVEDADGAWWKTSRRRRATRTPGEPPSPPQAGTRSRAS